MQTPDGFLLDVQDGKTICLGWNGIGIMPPVPDGVNVIADDAFAGKRMTHVTFPDSLERIGRRAFEKCPRLHSLQFPDSLKVIDVEAFNGCQALESVSFGKGVEIIQARAFWYCIRISQITLPASLKLLGSRAFEGCDKLDTVIIQNPGAEFDEYAFNETPYWHRLLEIADRATPGRLGLTPECPRHLILPEGHTHIDLYAYARSRIVDVRLPGSLRTMGMCAFKDCKELETVSISPNTYCNYHLPLEAGEGIFAGCSKLHTVTIHGRLKNFTWDGADAPELLKGFHPEKTFLGCINLHRIIAWQVPLSAFPSQWVPYAINSYLEDEQREIHFETADEYDTILSGRSEWLIARAIREGERPIVQYLCEKQMMDLSQWSRVMQRVTQNSDAPSMARMLNYRAHLQSCDVLANALDDL